MKFIRFLFWLPSILLQGIMLILPFNKLTYRPSTEQERMISQDMRNMARLTMYKIRKIRSI